MVDWNRFRKRRAREHGHCRAGQRAGLEDMIVAPFPTKPGVRSRSSAVVADACQLIGDAGNLTGKVKSDNQGETPKSSVEARYTSATMRRRLRQLPWGVS